MLQFFRVAGVDRGPVPHPACVFCGRRSGPSASARVQRPCPCIARPL